MGIKYFKLDILIDTCCDHCGAQYKETLGRLYSDEKLYCAVCGCEHTADRDAFRKTVDETEATISKLPDWPGNKQR
jgi:hydrogenase maturation factor HypF (carbamoyltransferase family)